MAVAPMANTVIKRMADTSIYLSNGGSIVKSVNKYGPIPFGPTQFSAGSGTVNIWSESNLM